MKMNAQSKNRMLWAFFFLCFLSTVYCLLPTASIAQVTFERTYGGAENDRGYSVIQTSNGGFIITGSNESSGAGGSDVFLIRTDSLGQTLWTKTYGDTANDGGISIQRTLDGGFIIAGFTQVMFIGGGDVYLIKTDSLGDSIWTKTYGGMEMDGGTSVQQTSDGGYIIAGSTQSFGVIGNDVYLIKTDSLGDTLWTKTYGSIDNDYGSSVQQTPDGGYIIVGNTFSFGAGNSDVYLIKTDSLGDSIWTKTYGGAESEDGNSIQQTQDSGFIIVGFTFSFGAGVNDVYLIKTDSLGDTLWTGTYGGIGSDGGFTIQKTSDGGYIIVGGTRSFGAGSRDVYLIKTDSLGDTLWTRSYGGIANEAGFSVQETMDGGYIISGWTDSFGAGLYDVYLIKTDSLGNVQVGVEEEGKDNEKLKMQNFKLMQNHPNPFHYSTVIRYQIPYTNPESNIPNHVSLKIYDLAGRLVETLVDEKKKAGVYQVFWDGRSTVSVVRSGIYFYRLKSGDNTTTRKMILLR
jgi:hypothetical protein